MRRDLRSGAFMGQGLYEEALEVGLSLTFSVVIRAGIIIEVQREIIK